MADTSAWLDPTNYAVDTTTGNKWWMNPESGNAWVLGGTKGAKPAKQPGWMADSITGIENAPEWWTNKTSSRSGSSRSASMINALIPYMSTEDQQSVATFLYQTYPKWFGEYKELPRQSGESQLSTETKDWFTSAERAQQATATLQSVAKAVGRNESKMGAGYRFLQNYLNIVEQYGGSSTNRQTRQQYLEMSNALSDLVGGVKGTSAEGYASVAQMLSSPTFTVGGNVTQVSADTTSGDYYFGSGNPKLYG